MIKSKVSTAGQSPKVVITEDVVFQARDTTVIAPTRYFSMNKSQIFKKPFKYQHLPFPIQNNQTILLVIRYL